MLFILLMCIVLSFTIIVTLYLEKRNTPVPIREKMTDDVRILFVDQEDER